MKILPSFNDPKKHILLDDDGNFVREGYLTHYCELADYMSANNITRSESEINKLVQEKKLILTNHKRYPAAR